MDAPPTVSSSTSPSSEQDVQHLRLLGVFYYIFGGLSALGGCISVVYIVIGVGFLAGGIETDPGDPPAEFFGGMFAILGACAMIFLFAFAALYIATGYFLYAQRNRIFCMVMAALSCLSVPLGTILDIFTLIVLSRPGVIDLFERNRQAALLQR